MRSLTFGVLGLLLLGSGCRSEIPSDSTLCWNLSSGQSGNTLCEPRLCFQDVRRDSLSANPWTCRNWSLVTPENLSTDDAPRNLQFLYMDPVLLVGNFISVYVDNRVTLDPSLENFRRYVRSASGKYETYQGETEFATDNVEVLDYANGRLKVRIQASFKKILSGTVNLSGQPSVCSYHAEHPGSDPEDGEIILEIEGPVDTTPPAQP